MIGKQLEASVRAQRGVAHIDLHGEINAFAEEALNAAYSEATTHKPDAVSLNFKDVDYINSTGIALIVGLLVQGRKSGLRLVAYGLSDHYVEIFRITRLADYIDLFPDEDSAMADISESAERSATEQ